MGCTDVLAITPQPASSSMSHQELNQTCFCILRNHLSQLSTVLKKLSKKTLLVFSYVYLRKYCRYYCIAVYSHQSHQLCPFCSTSILVAVLTVTVFSVVLARTHIFVYVWPPLSPNPELIQHQLRLVAIEVHSKIFLSIFTDVTISFVWKVHV